ncbi:hypothetical protein [Paenibacillus guangzhouensis]|uniref:hypothetical protein n=1 Tax=Paenibacillus guangzhouensis TaxID=1473112 RepID=UPI0038990D7A
MNLEVHFNLTSIWSLDWDIHASDALGPFELSGKSGRHAAIDRQCAAGRFIRFRRREERNAFGNITRINVGSSFLRAFQI